MPPIYAETLFLNEKNSLYAGKNKDIYHRIGNIIDLTLMGDKKRGGMVMLIGDFQEEGKIISVNSEEIKEREYDVVTKDGKKEILNIKLTGE